MSKMIALFKKIALAALVLAIGLALFPGLGVSAAGMKESTLAPANNSRLEKIWAREQKIYQREGSRLALATTFIDKVQALIDKANAKGWDTSGVQAALNALAAVIPAVQAAHDPGAAILASHAGFDASGMVTDRATAITTAKSLATVLQNTHTAMNGTGRALHEAIQAFREAHPRPTATPIQ